MTRKWRRKPSRLRRQPNTRGLTRLDRLEIPAQVLALVLDRLDTPS